MTPERIDGPLDDADVPRVLELAQDARAADGVEALGEQTLLQLREAGVHHLLVRGADAAIAGYAQLEKPGEGRSATTELVVAPQHRRRGIGTALLAAVLDDAAALGTEPAVWAHGNLPAAQRLATGAGLVVGRELWQMTLDLSGPPATPGLPSPGRALPDGVVVRPFVVGSDEEAWLRVNARAFAGHPEQGRMTLRDVEAREAEPWFAAEDLLLAERDGTLVASVWMKVEPGSDEGELYVLAVDPDAQGAGLGRLLTALTVDHLRAKGLRRVALYVSPSDPAPVRTYLSAGFRTSRADVQYGLRPAQTSRAQPTSG